MNITAAPLKTLFGNPILQALTAFARTQQVTLYLVGGSVRDLLLGRETADIDFALPSDAVQFAQAFAANIRGVCIPLEENPPTARVVVKSDAVPMSIDFAQFRAPSLLEDLRLRDLTINAMAIAVEAVGVPTNETPQQDAVRLIDPCAGIKDLEAGILRFPSEEVIKADPVRLLRIYRFAAQLNFYIHQDAKALITKYRGTLSNIAPERCRDELLKTFKVKNALPFLQQMAGSGLLTQVIPNLKEKRAAWRSVQTFEETPIPKVLHAYRTEINDYLETTLGMQMDRRALIKFSLLLEGDSGVICKRLRFSRKAAQFMKTLMSGNEAFRNVAQRVTHKQIIHFLRTYDSEWWGILLYAAVSSIDSDDSELLKLVTQTYYEHVLPVQKQGRLITGSDLIRVFHFKEGAQIGDILQEIEERQFNGEIRTREEAFAAVEALIQKHR